MSVPAAGVELKAFLDTIPMTRGHLTIPRIIIGSGEDSCDILKEILSAVFNNGDISSIDLQHFPKGKHFLEQIQSESFYEFVCEVAGKKYHHYAPRLLQCLEKEFQLKVDLNERFSNAIALLAIRNGSIDQLRLHTFCKHPTQLDALKEALSRKVEFHSRFSVSISELKEAELGRLLSFLENVVLPVGVDELQILCGKAESEYKIIMEVIGQVKGRSLKKLTLQGKVGELPAEQLENFFKHIVKTSWLEGLCLEDVGLEKLTNPELLGLGEYLKESEKLTSLKLNGNRLKCRHYYTLSKFIDSLSKIKSVVFWNSWESWPSYLSSDEYDQLAYLVMQLLSKGESSDSLPYDSPFLGLGSKSEECDYICRFMKANPQKINATLNWVRNFSKEQQLQLARAYLEAGGSRFKLESFDLVQEELSSLGGNLKQFIDTIPAVRGRLEVPSIIGGSGESALDILKAILSAAFRNPEINDIGMYKLLSEKHFREAMDSEVCCELIADIISKTPYSSNIYALLASIKYQFGEKVSNSASIENGWVIARLRANKRGLTLNLHSFCKVPAQLEALKGALATSQGSDQLNVDFSKLEVAELALLSDFFSQVDLSKQCKRLTIIASKIEAEYKTIMEMVEKIKRTPSERVSLELELCGNLGMLPVGEFKTLLSFLSKTLRPYKLSLSHTGLDQLNDTELLELIESIKKSDTLTSLILSKNNLKKRPYETVLALIGTIEQTAGSIILWDDTEEPWPEGLTPEQRLNLASMILRLYPKEVAHTSSSPISGLVSKQEAFEIFIKYMRDVLEIPDGVLNWLKDFTDEQRLILAKTYLEVGGSINNIWRFNLTAENSGSILKMCLEAIPRHSGWFFSVPNPTLELGESRVEVLKILLAEALKRDKITHLSLSEYHGDEEIIKAIKSQEFYQFMLGLMEQENASHDVIKNLLGCFQSEFGLERDRFEALNNELAISTIRNFGRQRGWLSLDLNLEAFAKHPGQLASLKAAIVAMNAPRDRASFSLRINVSELNGEALTQLCLFLNTAPLRGFKVTISFANIEKESKEMMELIRQINNVSITELTLIGELGTLEIESLKALLKSILQAPWIETLCFPEGGLKHLQDNELLEVAKCFKNNARLVSLTWEGNDLRKRAYQTYSSFAEHILQMPKLKQLSLKDSSDEASSDLPASWTEKDRKNYVDLSMRLLSRELSSSRGYGGSRSFPISGLVEKEVECEHLCQLISEKGSTDDAHSVSYYLRDWIKDFSAEQRFKIAETCLKAGYSLSSLGDYHLSRKDLVELFLLYGADSLEEDLYVFKKCESSSEQRRYYKNIDIFDSEFVARDLIDAWKVIEEMPTDVEDGEIDYEEFKENIIEKLIPALGKANQAIWPENAFYKACFAQVTELRQKVVTSEPGSIYRWAKLLQWYTWCMSNIARLNIAELSALSPILKEIAAYANPKMRYTLSETLFTLLKGKKGQELLFDLTRIAAQKDRQKKASKAAPAHVFFLPEIFLSKIILQVAPFEKEKSEALIERKDHKERSELQAELLKLVREIQSHLSSNYGNGHYMRSFISALSALSNDNSLSSRQKLQLIRNFLEPQSERLAIETALKDFFSPLLKEEQVSSAKLNVELRKLLGEPSDKILSDFKRYFNKDMLLTPRELKAIARGVKAKVSQIEHEKEFRFQISYWYMLEGFSLLNEIVVLAEKPAGKYREAILKIFQDIFKIGDDRMRFYQVSIGANRNESAVLNYLAKIRSLKDQENRKILEDSFTRFIRSILTEKQVEFYRERYNTETRYHLKVIFDKFPHLKALWPQNQQVSFNEFLTKQGIIFKRFRLDSANFLINKICHHKHLNPVDYPDLKLYLDNISDSKIKREIKERLEGDLKKLKSFFNEKTPESANYELAKKAWRISVQLELIRLAEMAVKNEGDPKAVKELEKLLVVEQRKCINNVSRDLRKLQDGYEFQNDLSVLLKNLVSANRPLDLKQSQGWVITFTDHYWDMFMCGTDVEGSCQRIDGDAELNQCLAAYIWDGKDKMVTIQNSETGELIARRIVRLLWDNETLSPVLYLEEAYPMLLGPEQSQALEQFAKLLADDLGVILVSDKSTVDSVKYPNALASLSGVGTPEYVDANGKQEEEGIFTIVHSQIIHVPQPRKDLQRSPSYFKWKSGQIGKREEVASSEIETKSSRESQTVLSAVPSSSSISISSSQDQDEGVFALTQEQIRENARNLGVPLRFSRSLSSSLSERSSEHSGGQKNIAKLDTKQRAEQAVPLLFSQEAAQRSSTVSKEPIDIVAEAQRYTQRDRRIGKAYETFKAKLGFDAGDNIAGFSENQVLVITLEGGKPVKHWYNIRERYAQASKLAKHQLFSLMLGN